VKKTIIFVFCSLLSVSGLLTASVRAEDKPLSRWQRFELENGLVFFTQEDHTTNMVSHHIFVHTGSRNERPGITNISHLIEHLRWGGDGGEEPYEKQLKALGGSTGGHTFPDFTDYIDSGPSEALELMIESGAKFLSGIRTDEDRFKAERDVVLSEDLLANSNPNYVAMRHLFSTAFQAHPYKNQVGGWRSDTENISLDDVKIYFETCYTPANTAVFLCGDFVTPRIVSLITKHYGSLPRGREVPTLHTVEPPQNAEKQVRFFAPVSNPSVWVGYHVPGLAHEDVPALQIAYSVLTNGRSARLHKSLVEDQEMALTVNPYGAEKRQWRKDPSLLVFGVSLRPDVEPEKGKMRMICEIEKLAEEEIDPSELFRAVRREMTDRITCIIYPVWKLWFVTSRTEQAGYYHALTGNPDYVLNLIESYKKVAPQDIMAVSKKYFKASNRTTVLLVPEKSVQIERGGVR